MTNLDAFATDVELTEASFRPHGSLVAQFTAGEELYQIYQVRWRTATRS